MPLHDPLAVIDAPGTAPALPVAAVAHREVCRGTGEGGVEDLLLSHNRNKKWCMPNIITPKKQDLSKIRRSGHSSCVLVRACAWMTNACVMFVDAMLGY